MSGSERFKNDEGGIESALQRPCMVKFRLGALSMWTVHQMQIRSNLTKNFSSLSEFELVRMEGRSYKSDKIHEFKLSLISCRSSGSPSLI